MVDLGMIKKLLAPFKALPTGYYRLFLLFWVIVSIVCGITDASLRDNDGSSGLDGFVVGALLYYPFMRAILWVYNGFRADKK